MKLRKNHQKNKIQSLDKLQQPENGKPTEVVPERKVPINLADLNKPTKQEVKDITVPFKNFIDKIIKNKISIYKCFKDQKDIAGT